MNDSKGIAPLEEDGIPPANVPTLHSGVDVERIRSKGGYFVGTVGWAGLVTLLIRRGMFFVLSAAITLGGAACLVLFDESVRIGLRTMLGTAETPRGAQADGLFPILEGESRNELSVRWKQLLSAIRLEQSTYSGRFVGIVGGLTLDDIRRIDEIAPYVVGGAVLRNSEKASGHDVPDLQWADFARLKTIGVLQQGQLGQSVSNEREGRAIMLDGTTLALVLMPSDSSNELKIPVTALTEEGTLIVELLNRPTSLRGLCESASRITEEDVEVQIWTKFEPNGAWMNPQSVRNATTLCSSN